MEWGDAVAKLGPSEELPKEKQEQDDCYRRTNEKLTLNEVPIDSVRYCFLKGRFVSAVVSFDKKVRPKVMKAVVAAYGTPEVEVTTYASWGDSRLKGGGTVGVLSDCIVLMSNDGERQRQVDAMVKARKDLSASPSPRASIA
jgi:hypothetical protein